MDFGHDKVADGEGDGGSGTISTLSMDSTAFFGEQAEDLFGELSCRTCEAEEGVDIRSLLLGGSRSWS